MLIRNVPDRLHRELTRRARRRNQTLTGYIEERPYDASYIALAEALRTPLLTLDGRLARAVSAHTDVQLRPA